MSGIRFALRFPEADIEAWAARNPDPQSERKITDDLGPAVRSRGYLTRREFLDLCRWKSPRSKPHCEKNSEHSVRTLTRAALTTSDEALKMDLLRLLQGVEWPTASTILHFCDERPYPVLDIRVLWSLGFAAPRRYTMVFWLAYLEFMRALTARVALPIRVVDRALWGYSKHHQPRRAS